MKYRVALELSALKGCCYTDPLEYEADSPQAAAEMFLDDCPPDFGRHSCVSLEEGVWVVDVHGALWHGYAEGQVSWYMGEMDNCGSLDD